MKTRNTEIDSASTDTIKRDQTVATVQPDELRIGSICHHDSLEEVRKSQCLSLQML